MGKLSHEPYIHHFSHPHPLELTNVQPGQLTITFCSCCTLRSDPGALIYTCRTCSVGGLHGGGGGYNLHVSCAQMPSLITHPSHTKHPLSLYPSPPYQGTTAFNCDACARPGSGFCYHCPECDFDLHPTCASKPLSAFHPRHHHNLALEFFPPYPVRAFSCDVCGGTGKDHWLYRCPSCEFDLHLDCATSAGGGQVGQAPPQPQPQPKPQPGLQHYPSYPGPYNNNVAVQPQQYHHLQHQNSAPPTLQNYQYQPQPAAAGYNYSSMPAHPGGPAAGPHTQQVYQQQQPGGQPGNNNGLGNMMLQSFIDGAGQQAGQTAVQDLTGGGGNGGSGGGSGSSGGDNGSSGGDNGGGGGGGGILGALFGGGGDDD